MESQSCPAHSGEVGLFPRAEGTGEYLPRIRLIPDRIVEPHPFRADKRPKAREITRNQAAFLGYLGIGKAGPSL